VSCNIRSAPGIVFTQHIALRKSSGESFTIENVTASLFEDHRLQELHEALLAAYGPPPERVCWSPLRQFVYSLLSSRTKTETSHEVLYALEKRFATWEVVRDAPVQDVLEVIAPVTFAEKKAPALQKALRRITRQNDGKLSLDFLHGHSEERIRRWLESFDGVGAKTSASVVNFSTIRGRALAVDSHHDRIAKRLHLVPRSVSAEEAERRLMAMAPAAWGPEMLDDHHSLVKLHGQVRCTKVDFEKNCEACPLLKMCPTGDEEVRKPQAERTLMFMRR
jgi:endonuclease-3